MSANGILIMWIVAIIAFTFIEIITPQLISIWFAVGSLAALIAYLLGASLLIQIIVFVVFSALFISIFYPYYKKHLKGDIVNMNAGSIIGKDALVVKSIDNTLAIGQINVGGQIWSARSEDGKDIEEGKKVLITSIEGVKAIVKEN